MKTSRERFFDTCEFKPVDRKWVRWGSFVWPETEKMWRTQGYDGTPLDEVFGLDRLERVDPYYGPLPEFSHEVVQEDERTLTYINEEGILMKEFKEHSDTSMPQFIKFPVENREDYQKFKKERLQLAPDIRFHDAWKKQVAEGGRSQTTVGVSLAQSAGDTIERKKRDRTNEVWPRLCWADRWGGFFGPLRNLLGVQGLCMAFYEQPELVHEMMEDRANAIIEITEETLKYTSFETFWYWEDMAYKGGPLVSPEMFREFALPHYRRVNDYMRSKGIKHIGLDSDGNIWKLIPLWIDAGIDILWPFEVQAGMDVNAVRKEFGKAFMIFGGIDKKEIAKGGDKLRAEVDRIMPTVEDGGYIPELDHSVHPDITWPVFCEYLDYLSKRLGWG
ncbi:MAG: uroporphyrinogen decarboxylase family protein [Spirochaetia bacterium]